MYMFFKHLVILLFQKLDVPLSCCKLTNNDPQNPQAMNLKRCQEHGAGGIAESQYVNGRVGSYLTHVC